ncbi:MAG: PhzF family phenazine biosynthesis protein [Flavobacteriales bacterium]
MSKTISTYIVDSFTNQTFKGNPAGVCILKEKLSDQLMFSIAKELALSETAFVYKNKGSEKYSIRYFSPKKEIPLCGHATLAASKVFFEKEIETSEIQFVTAQGVHLITRQIGNKIQMEFPVYKTIPANASLKMLAALGLDKVVNCEYNKENNMLLLEIEDSNILANLKPNFQQLIHSHQTISGVVITSLSKKEDYDFESRYFWPWVGTNEDPVTGATHTFLTKYWSERLHKKKMKSFQCSERTGFMEVQLIDEKKMLIIGEAKIVLEGKLKI